MTLASGALRLALALAAVPLAGAADGMRAQQSSVTFTVFAAETQQALAGARVSVDSRARGVTDARGELRVPGLSPGTHRASVELIGRIPRAVRLDLAAGEEREALVLMEPISVALPGITAAARERSRDRRIEEFYRRAQHSTLGRFVTRAQIEERNAILFTDIFRDIPGVLVLPGPGGPVIRSPRAMSVTSGTPGDARSGRAGGGASGGATEQGKLTTGGGCAPRYFVDGFPYSGEPEKDLPLADIEGVEVYFGNVPAQWGGSRAMCGVIVVWTRTSAAPATSN